MNNKDLDFSSRFCRSDDHDKCLNKWQGLGFNVICKCGCHKEKNGVLARSGKLSNTTTHPILSLEEIKYDI